MPKKKDLIRLTARGLYCEAGDFYIDPWQPVKRALVTHAHGDHTYRGSRLYLVPREGERLSRLRLGEEADISTMPYGEERSIGDVKVSFHPAGHILGSAQIRVECGGEVWVVSGDYKLAGDATCAPFEPVRCNHFITEATFALPIYRWQPTEQVISEINDWWLRNRQRGKASVLFAYALGKSQRILSGVDASTGNIYTHGSVERLIEAYREAGVLLPPTKYVDLVGKKSDFAGSLVLAPPSAAGSAWLRRFGDYSTGYASGWMLIRGKRRQRAVDRGFVLSDHADWTELQTAVRESAAERVHVTHGYIEEFVSWLREQGADAVPLKSKYGEEEEKELQKVAES
jgi:putative mRNA 3-end processing factor